MGFASWRLLGLESSVDRLIGGELAGNILKSECKNPQCLKAGMSMCCEIFMRNTIECDSA